MTEFAPEDPPERLTRPQVRAIERGRAVMEYRVYGGQTFRQIAARMGISKSQAHRLYIAGLNAYRSQRHRAAGVAYELRHMELERGKSEAYKIAHAENCMACRGMGRRRNQDTETLMECPRCGGSGRANSTEQRLRALSEFRGFSVKLAELEGLFEPDVAANVNVNLFGAAEVSDEMLTQRLADVLAPLAEEEDGLSYDDEIVALPPGEEPGQPLTPDDVA